MQSWDSLYIYYLSGTGNTRISSQWIAEEAGKRGLRTVVQQIDRLENIVMPSPDEKPLIGFAFPTHGFNAAPIMLKFMAGFPPHLCSKIFLLNTRGCLKLYKIFVPGFSGLALILPAFMLWMKGYKCIGIRSIDMPSNWMPLHPGLREKVIESIIHKAEPIIRIYANKILSGQKVWRGLYSLPADLLISPISVAYYIGGRFFLSKTFIANNKCNNCMICIKECPTASIKLVGNRPYWKLTCESCMRCLNHCPLKAIEAAHGMATAFMIIMSAVNTWLILFMVQALNIEPEAWWWKILTQFISIAVMISVAAVLYLIMHYAMGFKPINYLVRFTSLTTLPFWRRYKFLKKRKENTTVPCEK
ncbi:MAG: EFR1 family ferrodoxin [Bacteroidia bacterium]|nr:EFR1 family ferrodoxin [Bacteroidia bacterium]